MEDTDVAHVVAARLLKDGLETVVVDKPSRLLEEAKKGVSAVALQDRYPSGEAATSLLRQIRVARNEAVPAIVLLTGDIPQGDRLVLENQYKVRQFMRAAENPLHIAQAVGAAAGNGQGHGPSAALEENADGDLELHPDEAKNEFDISVESVNSAAARANGSDRTTQEVSAAELERLRLNTSSPRSATQEAVPDGGDESDVQTLQPLQTSVQDRPGGATPSPISVLAPPDPGEPSVQIGNAPDEEDFVQTQQPPDLQKAQNDLKKALFTERKQRELAQKRVEELEAKLAKVGDITPKVVGGVPTEGVFEDIRYPALLARCRAEAFTGAIMMQAGGASRNVYLKDGLPVAFHSSEPGERIGKVLVTQGRISDAQYMQATTRSVERSIKLVDALVELGWMDSGTIGIEQRNLARDQIISNFELVQGRFTVQQGAVPDANMATFDFGPGEIYVQGYRRYAPPAEMMATYETLRDKYLVANARLASYRPKLGLTGEDERLLRLLGEAYIIEEAVERAQAAPEAAARLLSALQALELVEEWSPGVEQFRSRLLIEKQRHVEEIGGIVAGARQREQRLLEAFEKALSKLGAGSLSAHLEGNAPLVKPTNKAVSAPGPSAKPAAAASPAPSASPVPSASPTPSFGSFPSASPTQASGGPFVHQGSGSGSAVVVTSASAAASEPKSTRDPAPQTLSPADAKYKEGVEQAAQSRLDEAEVTLREAVRLDASKPEYLTSLARVLLANPRYERAGTLPVVRSLLDRAVQIAPDFQEAVDLHSQVMKEIAS